MIARKSLYKTGHQGNDDQMPRSDRKRNIVIRNTLTGSKVPFVPISEGKVGMYVCGPTVYGEPHLGHARSAITFDVVYRYFSFLGYQVRYVRNITDVGHLEDEAND